MEGNNQPRQFSTFPVHQYDQAQLRHLVEQDRKRKKKIAIIAGTSILVLVGLGTLLYFLLSGGGMTPSEYQQKVLPQHQTVMSDLEEVKVEWKDAYYDVFVNNANTDPYKQDCANMIGKVDEASTTIVEAITLLNGITPPKEAEALQADLLAYYGEAQGAFAKVKDMNQYLPALASFFGSMTAEANALPKTDSTSTMAEYMANMDSRMTLVVKYRDQLATLAPTSGECQQINATLLDYFNTIVGLNEQFYAAANSYDLNGMKSVSEQVKAENEVFQANYKVILQPLDSIATEYALFLEKGKAYTAQLEDLTAKK